MEQGRESKIQWCALFMNIRDSGAMRDVRFDPFKTDAYPCIRLSPDFDVCAATLASDGPRRYSFGITLYVMLLGEDCADLEQGDGDSLQWPQQGPGVSESPV